MAPSPRAAVFSTAAAAKKDAYAFAEAIRSTTPQPPAAGWPSFADGF
jgi:hypothetical protein